MNTLRMVRALSTADAASVGRDSLLRGMIIVPLGLAAAVRWVLPLVLPRISDLVGLDLAPFVVQFFSYVLLLLPPVICGMVVGFLLLDQRDEHTLRALEVTPLPLWTYLVYRMAAPMIISIAVTLVALPLAGVVAPDPLLLLMSALAAAPLAPATALFLGSFAANKVQGFALQKGLGLVLVGPALAQFLPAPWSALAGALPTYWPAALLAQSVGGIRWELFALGMLYQIVLLIALLRRWIAVLHR